MLCNSTARGGVSQVVIASSKITAAIYIAFQDVLRRLAQGVGIVSLFSHAKARPLISGKTASVSTISEAENLGCITDDYCNLAPNYRAEGAMRLSLSRCCIAYSRWTSTVPNGTVDA